MTLKDIAKRAGVSVSTVSRIINSEDNSFARKEVRDKVWEIIKETAYIPNQNAIDLKQSKRHATRCTINLTCILGCSKNLEETPFYAQVARSIEQKALSLGYVVSLSYSILDITDKDLLHKIETTKTDGAIILGQFHIESLKFLKKHYKNLIYVGRTQVEADIDQIICDGYEASKSAIQHLIQKGHKRIGYIGETTNEVRYKAYKDVMTAEKLSFDRNLVCSCRNNGDSRCKGADLLIKKATPLPTAIFCATDIAAIAAMKRMKKAGIKIPQDISIISMDDIEMAAFTSPMLTTISMPKSELGHIAVQTLISRIHKNHKLPIKIYVPYKLSIRESVSHVNH